MRGESIEKLVAYCRENNRVCPMPDPWDRLWKMLRSRNRVGEGWQPPQPLILAAWYSPVLAKMRRLEEHIEWAADHKALEMAGKFLRELPEDEWFHVGN
jgi:hypothetical protein